MLAQSLESIFMKASEVDNTQRAAMQIIKRGKKGKKKSEGEKWTIYTLSPF